MKVIKIGAIWCNGCLVMKPRWQEIEKENPELITEYYDFDSNKEIIEKYKINSGVLPVFIFEDNQGKEIKRLSGEVEKEKIVQLIKDCKDK